MVGLSLCYWTSCLSPLRLQFPLPFGPCALARKRESRGIASRRGVWGAFGLLRAAEVLGWRQTSNCKIKKLALFWDTWRKVFRKVKTALRLPKKRQSNLRDWWPLQRLTFLGWPIPCFCVCIMYCPCCKGFQELGRTRELWRQRFPENDEFLAAMKRCTHLSLGRPSPKLTFLTKLLWRAVRSTTKLCLVSAPACPYIEFLQMHRSLQPFPGVSAGFNGPSKALCRFAVERGISNRRS